MGPACRIESLLWSYLLFVHRKQPRVFPLGTYAQHVESVAGARPFGTETFSALPAHRKKKAPFRPDSSARSVSLDPEVGRSPRKCECTTLRLAISIVSMAV